MVTNDQYTVASEDRQASRHLPKNQSLGVHGPQAE